MRFSLTGVFVISYGFTNVSEMEDVRQAYPLLDMVDRERRYNHVNVCIMMDWNRDLFLFIVNCS